MSTTSDPNEDTQPAPLAPGEEPANVVEPRNTGKHKPGDHDDVPDADELPQPNKGGDETGGDESDEKQLKR